MHKNYFNYFTPVKKNGGKVRKFEKGGSAAIMERYLTVKRNGADPEVLKLIMDEYLRALSLEADAEDETMMNEREEKLMANLPTDPWKPVDDAMKNEPIDNPVDNPEKKLKWIPGKKAREWGELTIGDSDITNNQVIQGVAQGMTLAANAASSLTTAGKNFDALSLAIDAGVHGVSSKLMLSGNPWLMAAGAGLEAFNAIDKMTGKNIPGFLVDGLSSSYGNLGEMDSKAMRGTQGGWNKNKVQNMLDKRNEQALMALTAASISEDVKYELEARQNSIDDTLLQNQLALAGGYSTDVLAAKKGGKLVKKAQNGAKLEDIETSEDINVLPTGAYHKNKNRLTELKEDITSKGIPVITVEDDEALTYEEIISQKDSIELHAEIEQHEILWNKETTDYLEDARKKWEETKDDSILLEVGMRITKELLFNTKDNDTVIKQELKKV